MRHRRRLALAAAAVGIATVVAGCSAGEESAAGDSATATDSHSDDAATEHSGTASAVPAFTSQTVDGEAFDSASLEGQSTVMWFWAPWCSVCRAEADEVASLETQFGDEVTFLGVGGRSEDPAAMQDFVADTNTAGFTHLSDTSGEVWRTFGVVSQPSYAFLTSGGQVEIVVGSLSESDLEKQIEALV